MRAQWSDWDQTYENVVASSDEAIRLLNKLSKSLLVPAIVEFWDDSTKRSIGIGVGREKTVLTYQDSLEPPYFISSGVAKSSDTIWFCYGQEESEYMESNEVPLTDGWNAVKSFFEKSGRPANLSWEAL